MVRGHQSNHFQDLFLQLLEEINFLKPQCSICHPHSGTHSHPAPPDSSRGERYQPHSWTQGSFSFFLGWALQGPHRRPNLAPKAFLSTKSHLDLRVGCCPFPLDQTSPQDHLDPVHTLLGPTCSSPVCGSPPYQNIGFLRPGPQICSSLVSMWGGFQRRDYVLDPKTQKAASVVGRAQLCSHLPGSRMALPFPTE